nr:glutamine synthetase, catalytic domain protein protein [Tanacetum cinerariifolium]
MAILRFKALELVDQRQALTITPEKGRRSDSFGQNVFNLEAMRANMPGEYFKKLQAAIKHGTPVERSVADAVASAMKTWAMAKARGYTAWDPTSPAFIIETVGAKTLCIPTIFVAYTGEALDYKAPLLKSLAVLEKAAVDVCQYFDKDVQRVNTTLGIEQEYFLVDKALFDARPDLVMTGRTLFGHASAKGQQLEDHYFGSIPPRVHAFMLDFEEEANSLGIPLRTRHNEVAPNQFECAPTFEDANLAIDHNQLLMDVMDRVGLKHNFKVLLHEKPFAGVNGSGKHNN